MLNLVIQQRAFEKALADIDAKRSLTALDSYLQIPPLPVVHFLKTTLHTQHLSDKLYNQRFSLWCLQITNSPTIRTSRAFYHVSIEQYSLTYQRNMYLPLRKSSSVPSDKDLVLLGTAPSPSDPRRTMPLLPAAALVGARRSIALRWPRYVVSPRQS